MSDIESFGDEPSGAKETGRNARERARQLRAQAEVAWSGVQRVLRQEKAAQPTVKGALRGLQSAPSEVFLGGIGGSLLLSGVLYSSGRRTASEYVGIYGSIFFGLGLAAKLLARPRKRSIAGRT